MSGAGRALSNTAYSSVGLYSEYLLGLVASILVARALGPSELGVYGLMVWIVATAVIVANAGITTAAIKFVAELRGNGGDAYVLGLVRRLQRVQTVVLSAVLAGAVLLLLVARHRLIPGVDGWLLGLLLPAMALRAPYMFNIALMKGAQDFRATAKLAAIGAVSNLVLVAIAAALGAGLSIFVAIYAAIGGVYFAASRRLSLRLLDRLPDTPAPLPPLLLKRLRHHLRVVALTIVLAAIGSSEIELLFLNMQGATADAGVFRVANALALGAAVLVPGVVGLQLLPLMARAYGQGPQVAANQIAAATAWLLIFGAPLVTFGAVFADQLILLFYGAEFAAAGPVLAALILARVATTLCHGASAYLVSADRQTVMLFLTIAFGLLRLVGAWFGIRYGGLIGAVVVAVVLAVINSVSIIALALHETRTNLPWARLARIVIAAIATGVCSWPLASATSAAQAIVYGIAWFSIVYPTTLWLLRGINAADAGYIRAKLSRLRGRLILSLLRRRDRNVDQP